jgi:hypothetical protein
METYPIYKPDGKLAGFEIENTWISFHSIYKILTPIEGIQDIKHQFKSETCFVFTFQGEQCVIKELLEKNDRFWIGLNDNQNSTIDILPIHKAFQEHKQNKWIINLLSKIKITKIDNDNKKKSAI